MFVDLIFLLMAGHAPQGHLLLLPAPLLFRPPGWKLSMISKLAGDLMKLSFIFIFFVLFSIFCHLSEENVQIVALFEN
jgi:hypothetical protein